MKNIRTSFRCFFFVVVVVVVVNYYHSVIVSHCVVIVVVAAVGGGSSCLKMGVTRNNLLTFDRNLSVLMSLKLQKENHQTSRK